MNDTTTLRKRLAALILGTAIATGGLVALSSPSASAAAGQPVSTVRSSNGAYLQASGLCGGSSTGFDVVSQGFEYLQVGTVTASGTTWGAQRAVGQNARFHYSLPIAIQNKAYVVMAWDLTPRGWEALMVTTWFMRFPDLTYGTWFC